MNLGEHFTQRLEIVPSAPSATEATHSFWQLGERGSTPITRVFPFSTVLESHLLQRM